MSIVLPALAVAFAAFCVWLAVRIINRRERWAKWTLAGLFGVPLLYLLSFGPACWATSTANPNGEKESNRALIIYCPLAKVLRYAPPNSRFCQCLFWWMTLGTPKDYWIFLPVNVNRTMFVRVESW